MKKGIVSFLFILVSFMGFSQEETSVLFIGNSFTFMNGMPSLFQQIATAKGHTVFVDSVVEGGKNLAYHAGRAETYAMIQSRKWDYVVVQGHSNELAQPDSKVEQLTLPFAKQLVDSIRENNPCTQVMLYMTWGYKYGNSKWSPIASYDSMQYRIKNQYLRFADVLDARVSPVGEVWKHVRSSYSGINLYDPDNQHPSLEGSYLSACTFFASVFGESPLNNAISVKITPETRQIIEMNASQVVLNNLNQWRFIPRGRKLKPGFDTIIKDKTVQVFSTAEEADFVEWNFGDGFRAMGTEVSHVYTSKGSFKIEQKVTGNCGSKISTRTITID